MSTANSTTCVAESPVKRDKLNVAIALTFVGLSIMSVIIFMGGYAFHYDPGDAFTAAVLFFFFMVGALVTGLGIASVYEK